MNFECSLRQARMKGRSQRSIDSSDRCERVDPAKRRILQEKFEMAESYLGRFIANVLLKFTDKRDVEAVSCGNILKVFHCLLNATFALLVE